MDRGTERGEIELQAGEDETLEFDADVEPDEYELVVEEIHGGDTVETSVTGEPVEEDNADETDDEPPVTDEADDADEAGDDSPVTDDEDDVDDADEPPVAEDVADDDTFPIPGFGPALAIVAILAVAVALARLRSP